MRILLISLGYLPAVGWGGPVKVVDEDANELRRRGYEISICASNRLNKVERIYNQSITKDVNGLRVSYLKTYMIASWKGTTGPTLLALEGMRLLWKEIKSADLVHTHGTRNAIVLSAALFSRWQGKPFILQPHGTLPHIVSSIRIKKIFDKFFMRSLLTQASALIALHSAERMQILHAGGDAQRIHIVPNGMADDKLVIDPQILNNFRSRFSIPENRSILLFLGRINRKKGVDLLIESYFHLPDENRKKTHLVIAGPDDGQLQEAQGMVQQYELQDQVTFTGPLSPPDVKQAFQNAEIYILPCRIDTFPMTIVESCAAGVPIVVTDTCEIADIIAERAGTVVTLDTKKIAFAIQELLEDNKLREKYRTGARELIATTFSIQAVVDSLEVVYQRVFSEHQAHSYARNP